LIALATGAFLWRVALPAARAETYAFSAYYTAARLTIQGQAGLGFCEGWFFEQQRALGFGDRADFFCPNPPTAALALVPVAWLPPALARYAWVAVDLAMIGALLLLCWRLVGRLNDEKTNGRNDEKAKGRNDQWTKRSTTGLVFGLWSLVFGPRSLVLGPLTYAAIAAVVVALFRPLHAELRAGQVYTLLALCYTLWLYGFVAGRDRVCSAALAALALLKLAGWPLWLLMIAARRWRGLGWAIGCGVGAGLLTLPLFGLDFWEDYLFRQAPAISANPIYAVPAFQTLASLLRELFVFDPRWSPRPLVDAPWLATLLWWVAALALLGATLRLARRQPTTAALALLCLVVPLQPAGEQYHYTLLLGVVLVVLLAPNAWGRQRPWAIVGVASGLALLIVPAYFLATEAWSGWPWALLAYPRMYGALLLWAAIAWGNVGAGTYKSAARHVLSHGPDLVSPNTN
jgi:hypothetical protein